MTQPTRQHPPLGRTALVLAFLAAVSTAPAEAYIGPGAGFAFMSSFLVLFTTILLVFVLLLFWPFRALWRAVRRGRRAKPWIRRLIVVGLDGQDPVLTDRFMRDGRLPNFTKLAEAGCYHRLKTTFPSISPVAWSSFSTGTNPARHNIFDFLDRDPRNYLPRLSSTRIGSVDRFVKLGRFRIPLRKPEIRLLRRSKPFWTSLGEHDVWSTVLRVPITFPPDRFRGAQLSAMCAPDLLGSQGTFLLFTTRRATERFKEGGIRVPLERNGSKLTAVIQGPENVFLADHPPMELPLTIEVDRSAGRARVDAGGARVDLEAGRLSGWISIRFRAAPGIQVSGLCRMLVTEMDDDVSLYLSPLNIDPEKPAMPISHPAYYSTYLAKRIGPYATLGLAEDTWALNEGVIDDATFLEQTYDIDRERREMFLASMERLRRGTLACVFDATDRVQHMFWRYLEPDHPATRRGGTNGHRDAIERLYEHNDRLVGEVMQRLRPGDVLMVLSDHGCTSFRRGCNINSWLRRNGYLALEDGADGTAEWLKGVDWSRTRAFALGLTGMFLNLQGRESRGVVRPGAEAEELKREIIAGLSGLVDPETGQTGIREVFDTARIYHGPYLANAPDLLIGYNAGYRTSWDCASGVVAGPVFEDNERPWSGDHCVDPRLVPGVLFCNYPIDGKEPELIDIAPTALRLFGVTPPAHMEGRALFDASPLPNRAPARRARSR